MDDGNLGEVIEEEAEFVESCVERERKFANDDTHLSPSRWWFASSAFPMIAGTLGPVASAFSICALVRPWRQRLVPPASITDAPFVVDPAWLTTVNAIQLAVALFSNVFLLLNMARRVRFSIAQPITIIGWYISAICLLSLNATAAGPLLDGINFDPSELVWSQAYYYGIWAAILYFIDASLMVVTFYGASVGHYSKDFMLTPSQRTLMLQTIMVLMYLLLGALIFSNIEGWNYLDAVYWADVTLFTVGFGDFHPTTTLGRALMMPYALVGVISLGLVIGSIRSLVLDRGKRHVDARMEEKKRRKLIRAMTKHGDDGILEPIREDSGPQLDRPSDLPATEFERRKAEFGLMRQIQSQTSIRRRWVAMGISASSWIILWLVGAVIFVRAEKPYQDWRYFDGFYFCFVSLTTIGYGDATPVSPAGKSFFVFWSLLALPTMTVLISNAGDTVVKFIRDGTLRLGNITILPGEDKFSDDIRHIVNKLTCGRVFPGHKDAPEPKQSKSGVSILGHLSAPSTKSDEASPYDNNGGRPGHPNDDLEADRHSMVSRGRAGSTFTAKVRRSLSRLRDPFNDLPTGTDFHFLLISEIQVVAAHLREHKPHRYTFDQWAWYLKLIGEDENNAETHRKAKPRPKKHKYGQHQHQHHGHDNTNQIEHDVITDDGNSCVSRSAQDEAEHSTWSWVGHQSPLMGSQQESEWIMERLMDRLRESLSTERRRQLKMAARAVYGEGHHIADTQHASDAEKNE
ncbi:hypothetical protein B0T10DRAFT_489969 [Thelonectria olida]|uniref:Potassium channel domain-containing protein n=1 Tax=Thelonectria olida TaxID=1576542 RepID=A0A9P9ARC2_9HYPO|nr:hypothetical protein B0T10DRAFT_489969 [Thelonectria olida]